MKFRKDTPDEIISLLGEGVEMVGEISFSQGLRVDGVVKGKIRSEGALFVGAKGKVVADVEVQRISINGEFQGTIRASNRVEIHKDGKVYGEIYSPCLIIEAGAIFEGRCNMSEQKAPKSGEATLLKAVESASDSSKLSAAAGNENS